MATYPTTGNPEYYSELYGGGEVSWIPPVSNYSYIDNKALRGASALEFRWEETVIPLENVRSGALLDFVMPDYYMVQITPDIGWHDQLLMFGETEESDRSNPHLANFGPFSIEGGDLTDNGDNSVSIVLPSGEVTNALSSTYPKHLWRAVPWANGVPGMGGIASSFDWIANESLLRFDVNPINPEQLDSIQKISGTKGSRVTISYEAEDAPPVTINQTVDTWMISFPIDRPKVKFRIVATDDGGVAISNFPVEISYESFEQKTQHLWNAFDSMALLASVDRLPSETNANLKARITDAFVNKGGTHYSGLISGTNRELGLLRTDLGIQFSQILGYSLWPIEPYVSISSTHTGLELSSPTFLIESELCKIDDYFHNIKVSKRIKQIRSIQLVSGEDLPHNSYAVSERLGKVDNTEIDISEKYTGLVMVTYEYAEIITYLKNPRLDQVVHSVNELRNKNGYKFIKATLGPKLSGSELSKNLYKDTTRLDTREEQNASIAQLGWSRIGLSSISNDEWKWSHRGTDGTFFESVFYEYVKELKSHTNVEWGHVVADEDYWDAVDTDWYGIDNLPVVFDINASHYTTNASLRKAYNSDVALEDTSQFDPYEAFRMNYTFNGIRIKNAGFLKWHFRSGVGHKKDCKLSIETVLIESNQSSGINLEPTHFQGEGAIDLNKVDSSHLLITL